MTPEVEKLIEDLRVEMVYLVEEEIPTYIVITPEDAELIARLKKGMIEPESDVNVVVLNPSEYERLDELNPTLKEMLDGGKRLV